MNYNVVVGNKYMWKQWKAKKWRVHRVILSFCIVQIIDDKLLTIKVKGCFVSGWIEFEVRSRGGTSNDLFLRNE